GEEMVFGDYPDAEKDFSPLKLHVLHGSTPGLVRVGHFMAVPGHYKVGYRGLHFREPWRTSLSTGTLNLEVKDPGTAWGRAVGGLQAGLEFSPAGQKVYRLGEKVPLRLLLRNVSGKPFKMASQDRFMWENPPTIRDSHGKPAGLAKFPLDRF